jgi:hypothetical protein
MFDIEFSEAQLGAVINALQMYRDNLDNQGSSDPAVLAALTMADAELIRLTAIYQAGIPE